MSRNYNEELKILEERLNQYRNSELDAINENDYEAQKRYRKLMEDIKKQITSLKIAIKVKKEASKFEDYLVNKGVHFDIWSGTDGKACRLSKVGNLTFFEYIIDYFDYNAVYTDQKNRKKQRGLLIYDITGKVIYEDLDYKNDDDFSKSFDPQEEVYVETPRKDAVIVENELIFNSNGGKKRVPLKRKGRR